VEMSEVLKFMLYRDGYVYSNWSSLWVRLCSQYRDYTQTHPWNTDLLYLWYCAVWYRGTRLL